MASTSSSSSSSSAAATTTTAAALLAAAATLFALMPGAYAACDNACSGHGVCGSDDLCVCFDNWRMGDEPAGDCSDRQCPFEVAWVDAPDTNGYVHKYAECAGRGTCNRKTGECECFPGYEGKGCQRTTCPNECSGHGICQFLDEMSFGSVWGDYSSTIAQDSKLFTLYSWDKHKTRGCLCDPEWAGLDCSRRMCPKATDIMHHTCTETPLLTQKQRITFIDEAAAINSKSFALTFKTPTNLTFTTVPIPINTAASTSTMAGYIETALETLPNYAIDDVAVTVATLNSSALVFVVEFTGDRVQGQQNLLIVEDKACSSGGCTPLITGLDLNLAISSVEETQTSELRNFECGRRGKCDYDSGNCDCFEGYTGLACNIQTALN